MKLKKLKEKYRLRLVVCLFMLMALIGMKAPAIVIILVLCFPWGWQRMCELCAPLEDKVEKYTLENVFYYLFKFCIGVMIGPLGIIYIGVRDIKFLRREKMLKKLPLVSQMEKEEEIFWVNEKSGTKASIPFSATDIDEAEARLKRFAPYLEKAFPVTGRTGGIIESRLQPISKFKAELEAMDGVKIPGKLFLKCDNSLPVSGSIKARGGIYEVLKFAESVAIEEGMLNLKDDYSILEEDRFKELFSRYKVAVGSTGNLGLSIGIISAKLGFQVTVHMSADAREWKKELLRKKGVNVVEYPDDYQKAVAEGRRIAAKDPTCHFVDDEGSKDLFLGYSVAGKRLVAQLEKNRIKCDAQHPVFVYIPCGVGGAPGGVTFGLKDMFGDNVHVFFAEPTKAPCMTLGLITGKNNKICVADIGLDGKTEADGLAVGRASKLVGGIMKTLLDGAYTIEDQKLFPYLAALKDSEGIFIEPSSCASFPGPGHVVNAKEYLEEKGLTEIMENATHILWATGGSMVPKKEAEYYYNKGKNNEQ